ncbi:MAG: hypothetical protein MJ219_01495 [Mycoplasmoidaceae bacterium]|nr:hypothetical protein [Mycoplasmoidaceae bacterium]
MGTPQALVVNITKTKQQLKEYERNTILGMSTGLMSWLAHPEIYLNSYKK